MLERRHPAHAHLEQQRELTRDVMALLHLVELHHPGDERGLEARVLDEHLHERGERRPRGAGVDDRHVAPDHSRLLELLQTLVDGSGRQTYLTCDLCLGQLGVALNQVEDRSILGVD